MKLISKTVKMISKLRALADCGQYCIQESKSVVNKVVSPAANKTKRESPRIQEVNGRIYPEMNVDF